MICAETSRSELRGSIVMHERHPTQYTVMIGAAEPFKLVSFWVMNDSTPEALLLMISGHSKHVYE
jgi:hypothetical protein